MDAVFAAFLSSASVLVLPLMVTYSGSNPLLDVDAELSGGQIAHVADGGPHVVARAEVLADRLGLGGRLDDDERIPSRARPRPGGLGASRPWASRRRAGAGLGLAGFCGLGRRFRLRLDACAVFTVRFGCCVAMSPVVSLRASFRAGQRRAGTRKPHRPGRCKDGYVSDCRTDRLRYQPPVTIRRAPRQPTTSAATPAAVACSAATS